MTKRRAAMSGQELLKLRENTIAIRTKVAIDRWGRPNTGTPIHLTQVEAAQLLGVHPQLYARYERGEISIGKTLAKLARILLVGDVEIDDSDT